MNIAKLTSRAWLRKLYSALRNAIAKRASSSLSYGAKHHGAYLPLLLKIESLYVFVCGTPLAAYDLFWRAIFPGYYQFGKEMNESLAPANVTLIERWHTHYAHDVVSWLDISRRISGGQSCSQREDNMHGFKSNNRLRRPSIVKIQVFSEGYTPFTTTGGTTGDCVHITTVTDIDTKHVEQVACQMIIVS